jgi:phosphoribosyl 1,2-cyclic phosphate phosphodiesterase
MEGGRDDFNLQNGEDEPMESGGLSGRARWRENVARRYLGGRCCAKDAGMEITFLGTGTSQGVPMIGCDCDVCLSSDPRDNRTRSSIYVKTPEAAWVVDTGPDFRAQCLREKVSWLDAVVYTHAHTDHVTGFDDLRRFCDARGGTMPIYAAEETLEKLTQMFSFAFDGTAVFPGYVKPEAHVIDGPFTLGETTLEPLRVTHGRAHVFGYLLSRNGEKRVAYISDCKTVSPEALEAVRGVPVLIVDALRRREHPTHMSVEEALAFREVVGAKQTWFTHLCHDLGHAATEAELPDDVRVAFDGLKITV